MHACLNINIQVQLYVTNPHQHIKGFKTPFWGIVPWKSHQSYIGSHETSGMQLLKGQALRKDTEKYYLK